MSVSQSEIAILCERRPAHYFAKLDSIVCYLVADTLAYGKLPGVAKRIEPVSQSPPVLRPSVYDDGVSRQKSLPASIFGECEAPADQLLFVSADQYPRVIILLPRDAADSDFTSRRLDEVGRRDGRLFLAISEPRPHRSSSKFVAFLFVQWATGHKATVHPLIEEIDVPSVVHRSEMLEPTVRPEHRVQRGREQLPLLVAADRPAGNVEHHRFQLARRSTSATVHVGGAADKERQKIFVPLFVVIGPADPARPQEIVVRGADPAVLHVLDRLFGNSHQAVYSLRASGVFLDVGDQVRFLAALRAIGLKKRFEALDGIHVESREFVLGILIVLLDLGFCSGEDLFNLGEEVRVVGSRTVVLLREPVRLADEASAGVRLGEHVAALHLAERLEVVSERRTA